MSWEVGLVISAMVGGLVCLAFVWAEYREKQKKRKGPQ